MNSRRGSRRHRALPVPAGTSHERLSAGSQVADYIRRLIFDGELKPGDRIPQDDVADVLSLSRIPVREGLIALEREGWIDLEMNRGAFVNVLDADAVRDSYELYGLVYGFATRRALSRADHTFVDNLADIEADLQRTDDTTDFFRLTLDFHRTIVDAARSPRIKVVLRASGGLVTGNFFEQVRGSIDVQREGAAEIRRAMRRSDAGRASAEYLAMLRRTGDLVVELFQERGLFDARTPD